MQEGQNHTVESKRGPGDLSCTVCKSCWRLAAPTLKDEHGDKREDVEEGDEMTSEFIALWKVKLQRRRNKLNHLIDTLDIVLGEGSDADDDDDVDADMSDLEEEEEEEEEQISIPNASANVKVGDYVFACRWSDADPCDPWQVGCVEQVGEGSVQVTGNARHWSKVMEIDQTQGDRIIAEYTAAEGKDTDVAWRARVLGIKRPRIEASAAQEANKEAEAIEKMEEKEQNPALAASASAAAAAK